MLFATGRHNRCVAWLFDRRDCILQHTQMAFLGKLFSSEEKKERKGKAKDEDDSDSGEESRPLFLGLLLDAPARSLTLEVRRG